MASGRDGRHRPDRHVAGDAGDVGVLAQIAQLAAGDFEDGGVPQPLLDARAVARREHVCTCSSLPATMTSVEASTRAASRSLRSVDRRARRWPASTETDDDRERARQRAAMKPNRRRTNARTKLFVGHGVPPTQKSQGCRRARQRSCHAHQ